ncbi:hypothetical protein ACFFP0_21855 [Rhizobium puerariae]|uniref:Uncharacterized protein n=1 Tax=Rhizobium puerariae TaxID=1585791 RepID=A0ABV6AQ94_9HYPH
MAGFSRRWMLHAGAIGLWYAISPHGTARAETLETEGFRREVIENVTPEPYPLTDDLFVSSAAGMRPASPEEARDHGRSIGGRGWRLTSLRV